MEERRTKFNLIFKDKNYEDWYITLYTIEPKTEEEIISLINYWAELNDRIEEGYSPVTIMDDLCLDKGWCWTDTEIKTITITDW